MRPEIAPSRPKTVKPRGRIKGCLLAGGAAASLPLAILVAATWLPSYWWGGYVKIERSSRRQCFLRVLSGHLGVDVGFQTGSRNEIDGRVYALGQAPGLQPSKHTVFRLLGFLVNKRVVPGSGGAYYVSVWLPYWFLLPVSLVPPAFWVRRRRREGGEHRRRMGLCVNCAYNLTGNVSGICPECGEKVDAQAIPKV